MSQKSLTRVMIFWDYDAQWGAERSRMPGGQKTWGPLEFENTEILLELHRKYDLSACFAVVGSVAFPGERPYHDPDQIRRIHMARHEVASHSLCHDWLPGLGQKALYESLRVSKDALEQCIGSPVVSFVPPWNQPFDYSTVGSFSLSERLAVRKDRTDLKRLCETLRETGYQFCRVAYQPLHERISERLRGFPTRRPAHLEIIAGITCIRLNTPGGFKSDPEAVLEKCIEQGGFAVIYGHPHSITAGADNPQDLVWLEPMLQRISLLKQKGLLEVVLPRDVLPHSAGWVPPLSNICNSPNASRVASMLL